MKKLPISIQSFAVLREHDCIYADKTELIYNLLTGGKAYFLSRPRRFGKSMTVSTIKEIFNGNKSLFEGLWIENKWDWTQTKPVIHIPFARLGYKAIGVEQALETELKQIASEYNITLKASGYVMLFDEIIRKLAKEIGKVVILIDEYDKPIIDFLESENHQIAKENRAKLREFYSCIKDNDENIEFFFMTGVSRFSHTGIFSHLNHLNDITTNKKYNNLVGITPDELAFYFNDRIDSTWQSTFSDLTREEFVNEIRLWYNGYSWDGENTVYNPFSILNFFDKEAFREFWFTSGSPKFLIDLLRAKPHFNFNNLKVPQRVTDSYEIENLEIRALLFQTGYLTVKHYDNRRGIYTLDYPNREVEQAMQDHLIALLLNKDTVDSVAPVFDIENAFLANDIESVVKVIKTMLKDVPSHLIEKKQEHFYHALIHLHFRYLGWYLESEVHTSNGRMDAVVKTVSHIYILEFKIDKTAATALQQIKDKDYAAKFALEKKKMVAVGINFDTENKTISDWTQEDISSGIL
jgi:Predicted AAA-ATPase/PD-(D/E)XK nuclease superfamily